MKRAIPDTGIRTDRRDRGGAAVVRVVFCMVLAALSRPADAADTEVVARPALERLYGLETASPEAPLPLGLPSGGVLYASYVKNLDPANAEWRPGSAKWDRIERQVSKDLGPVLESAVQRIQRDWKEATLRAYTALLSRAEIDELLEAGDSPNGKRYREFQSELDKVVGIASARMAEIQSGRSPPPATRMDETAMKARLRLVALSRGAQLMSRTQERNRETGQDTSGAAAVPIIESLWATLAGSELDQLGERYRDALPAIEQTAQWELHKKLVSAQAAALEAILPTLQSMMASLDQEAARHAAEWKALSAAP